MLHDRSRTTQISQMDRPSTAETVTLLRNSKVDSKAKSHITTVHQFIPLQQEECPISVCSAEANHTANRTLLHYATADKPIADWSHGQPSQPAMPCFSSKEKYSSVHFKGLTADSKTSQKTLHIWQILHRLHGKKKTKFGVRTLIQAYSRGRTRECNMRSKFR